MEKERTRPGGKVPEASASEAWEGGHGEASELQPSRKQQILEVSVFLFLIVPAMALSFFIEREAVGGRFTLLALATILRNLALVSLIFYFVWRNREPLSRLGLQFKGRGEDVLLGFVLFIPMFLFAGVVERLLRAAGLSPPSAPLSDLLVLRGPLEVLLATVLVFVVAFAEETIFRGYLILRLKAVTKNPFGAVILSAVVFSLGHGYQGTAGAITVGALGLILAIIYLWRGSLIAPMVMHFLQNFIGIVIIPLLGGR
jgi:uncharacterized protein